MPRIRRAVWSLGAGAGLTVAVAWACALWSPLHYQGETGDPETPPEWLVLKRPEGHISGNYSVDEGFGLSFSELVVMEPIEGPTCDWAAVHSRIESRAGWPAKALRCGATDGCFPQCLTDVRGGVIPPPWLHQRRRDEWPFEEMYLPLLPTWGFAADTAVYGAAVFALCGLPGAVRRRAGGCAACGYDLRGLAMAAPCPECGAGRTPRAPAPCQGPPAGSALGT